MNNQKAMINFLNAWLENYLEHDRQVGLSVAVMQAGETIFQQTYGLANIEQNEQLTIDHVHRYASHSKTFTAALFGRLYDKGVIRFDDLVTQHLPELAENKHFDGITIRHILSHSTGFIRDNQQDFWNLERPFPKKAELIDYYKKAAPKIEFMERLKYSNYTYALAALIAESVTGKSYEQLMQDEVIKPLELINTGVDQPPASQKTVMGYTAEINGKRYPLGDHIQTNDLAAVTGVYSQPIELCKFITSFFDKEFIKETTRKELTHKYWDAIEAGNTLGYGMGIQSYKVGGDICYGHGGGFPGQLTKTYYNPKNKVAVSVALNTLDGALTGVANSIMDIIKFYDETRGDAQKFAQYEGQFYTLWFGSWIVATAAELLEVDPNIMMPFKNAIKLGHQKGHVFVSKCPNSFGEGGDNVTFEMESGKAVAVFYEGARAAPKEEFIKQISALQSNKPHLFGEI